MAVLSKIPPGATPKVVIRDTVNTTYENAVIAGYVGSEQQFYRDLNELAESNVFPVASLPPLP